MIIAQNTTDHGEVILRTGAAGYEIIVDGQFLMSTGSGNSSVALVRLGMERLQERHGNLRVLIAGLGLGFSLQEAWSYPEVAEVIVVELEGRIIDWHCRGLIPGTHHLCRDSRVRIIHRDFIEYLSECREQFDLIAVDIDNGPDWLSHETNCRLYTWEYLNLIKNFLHQGGVATVWTANEADWFRRVLAEIFGKVTEVMVSDHNGEGKEISAFIYVTSPKPSDLPVDGEERVEK
jgi:spermidine synthase